MDAAALREAREAVIKEHMDSENEHRFDDTLGTFDHPRYELIASGEVYDGVEAVTKYYEATRTAFPDQRSENVVLHHIDQGVIVEFDLVGTHLGPIRGIEATGRGFRCRMCAVFLFEDDSDRIVCERIYYDQLTIMQQLAPEAMAAPAAATA